MDIQTISIVIAAAGLFIAAINSVYSSREAKRQRQTELFMELYREWRSPPFRTAILRMLFECSWDNYDDFEQKYGFRTNPKESVNTFIRQSSFYEGVGVLVEQGLIDINLVDTLLHNTIKYWWERMGPNILEGRRRRKPIEEGKGFYPTYDSAENLYI